MLQNIKRVLENQDIRLLQKPAYQILITHCGFIAHYNLEGFKGTFKDHLDAFVQQFLEQHGGGWEESLANPKSYLYDGSYRSVMLHELVRDLVTLFKLHQPGIARASEAKRTLSRVAALHHEAEALGFTVAPKE